MRGTTAGPSSPASTPPPAAGVVESGPGAAYVHLAFLLGDAGWATACPADAGGGGQGRHVRPTLARVDCPECRAMAGDLVVAVNRRVAERQQREAAARELLVGFLRWAAEEYPLDEGGAVLAVYAGGTRLHALRADERDRAVGLWLEATRRYPDGV